MIQSVLLVEDQPPMNFLNKMILLESNKVQSIDIALNGEEALSYLNNQTASGKPFPSIIFLDLNMPRMNGWEFLEEYKLYDESLRENTVIVILTSSTNPEDQAKGEQHHMVDLYRLKPITEELIDEIVSQFFSAV